MDKWEEFMQQAEALGEDLDIDLDWEEIQKKRKKRTFIAWFNQNKSAILGLVVVLFVIGFQLQNQYPEPASQVVVDTTLTTKEKLNNVDNSTTEERSGIVGSKNSVKEKSQVIDSEEVSLDEVTTPIIATPSFNAKNATPSNSIKNNQALQALVTNSPIEAIPTKNNVNKWVEEATDITNNNHKTTYSISGLAGIEGPNKEQKIQVPTVEESLYSSPRLDIISPMFLDIINKSKIQTTPRKIIQSQPSTWSIGLRSTYSMPFRKMEGSEETSVARRNNVEMFLEAVDVQLQVQKKITNKLYVASGITVSQHKSKFIDNYQLILTNVAFDNQVIERVIKNGVPVDYIGTVYGSRTELHTKTKYQRYIDVSIPIQLGIQLALNRTWSMKAASGLSYSLFHLNKGSVIASATSVGGYSSLNTLNYRTKGLLQSASNIELVKSFRGNIDITLGVQMKHDLNSRIIGNATTDKFHTFGANLGVMKRF